VIVFKPWVDKDKEYFIKRIIGLPWDRLKIEWWKVYLFDKILNKYMELDEWYLDEDSYGKTYIIRDKNKHEYEILEGNYFVMWDNRLHSTDSRTCFSNCNTRSNYIKKDDMTWKVLLDLWYFYFKTLSFIHPDLKIDTYPKFFNSQGEYSY
jgi:signal peptidase I